MVLLSFCLNVISHAGNPIFFPNADTLKMQINMMSGIDAIQYSTFLYVTRETTIEITKIVNKYSKQSKAIEKGRFESFYGSVVYFVEEKRFSTN